MDIRLLRKEQGVLSEMPIHLVENPHYLSLIAHPLRSRILRILAEHPLYPAEIAEKLGVHEQTIYYHIQRLHKAGILEVAQTQEIRGTIAKKFRPTAQAYCVIIEDRWHAFETVQKDSSLLSFLSPLITQGRFQGSFVVGSPEPHGPLRASARDGHYAADLALFLGRFVSFPQEFSIKLDVDVISAGEFTAHQILLGGPITNLMVERFNRHLPVRFLEEAPHVIYSSKTGRRYHEDTVGFVAKLPHPLDPKKGLIVLAGLRASGTKSAVIALTRHTALILKNYKNESSFVKVVKGFDLDGDGKIDSVEVLE